MKTLDLIVIPFLFGFSGCSSLNDDVKDIPKEYKRILLWDSYSQNDVDYNLLGDKYESNSRN